MKANKALTVAALVAADRNDVAPVPAPPAKPAASPPENRPPKADRSLAALLVEQAVEQRFDFYLGDSRWPISQ